MSLHRPLACVMGTMDLVRPLGLAGIRCAVVARPGDPPRFSRFSRASIDWVDPWQQPDELLERLLRFGAAQPERPVLFYHADEELLLVSRFRECLSQVFRFVVPDPVLVEDLVDKARFQALAERLSLPVPRARGIHPSPGSTPASLDLHYPIVIKPVAHRNRAQWRPLARSGKALLVDRPEELQDLWPLLAEADLELMAQELVPGPESCIESYHVYVDAHGEIAGEFTGRKIRTYPLELGHSTALVISAADDVNALGREVIRRLNFRGVAKLDFKRAPDGQLYLLEINPRFQLWHYPGAIAGVNLPALVYADLVGLPRPPVRPASAGVRWCRLWDDIKAARAAGVPRLSWLRWALSCEAKSVIAWDDPLPFLCASLWQLSHGLAGKARKSWDDRPRIA